MRHSFCSWCRQKNISPKLGCALKGFLLNDGKDTHETFSAAEVVISDGSVVFLSGSVEDVDLRIVRVERNLFSIRVGFCWLVVSNKLLQQNCFD